MVRHGETEWSATGRHTGHTDVPLTDRGRRDAAGLVRVLAVVPRFSMVLVSPLRRATETARLAGLGSPVEGAAREPDPDVGPVPIVDPDLREWDYGDYEGRTTDEIRATTPGWTVWAGGCPGGETIDEVAARARRVLATCALADGPVALVGHGHQLRVVTALYLGFPPTAGAAFALEAGAVGVLGREREQPALRAWNLR